METTRISHAARLVTPRLLPPLAAVLLACVSGSSDSTPAGTSPPTIASLSLSPQVAVVGDGGGMVGVTYGVFVSDPDADVARAVATVLDAASAQVSQVTGTVTNPPGATSGSIADEVFVPTAAAAAYTVEVQVFDGGGRGSNVLRTSFQVVEGNPVPVVAALSPATIQAQSGGFVLTVTGSAFVPESSVLWNGSSRTTRYVDQATLEADIGSYDVMWTGTAEVSVVNPFPGGGTSMPATFTIAPAPPPEPNPVPVLGSLSPTSVDAGTTSLTLTVTGSGFTQSSYVVFDGSYQSTTYVNATTLRATVSSYELTSPAAITVTVVNPTPGGGTSSGLTFTVTRPVQAGVQLVTLQANDVVWDPYQRKLYVSVPSLSAVNPNTVTVVDPFTGALGASRFVGSEPGRLALSDDGLLLYVALGGASSVQRLRVPDLALDLAFSLGSDASSAPYYARDLQVAPGAPATVAVSLATSGGTGSSTSGGIAVFDDATQRPTRAASSPPWYAYGSLQWGATASALYATSSGYDYDLYVFGVDASGVVLQRAYPLSSYTLGVRFDPGSGLVYGDDGRAIDPATGLVAGTYPVSSLNQRNVVPDSSLGSVFFVAGDSSSYNGVHATIGAYDMAGYFPTRSLVARYVGSTPHRAVRWGPDGLAFLTSGAVVLVRGAVVLPVATSSNPAPVATSLSPSSAAAAGPNLTVTVTGDAFVPGSVVLWNGSERTTRFVSATSLVAYVPASDVAAAGSAAVTVSTPAPGGGTSGAVAFTVSP